MTQCFCKFLALFLEQSLSHRLDVLQAKPHVAFLLFYGMKNKQKTKKTQENRSRVAYSPPNFYHTGYDASTTQIGCRRTRWPHWDRNMRGYCYQCRCFCADTECLQACRERDGGLIRVPTDNRCFKCISNRFPDQDWRFHPLLLAHMPACVCVPGSVDVRFKAGQVNGEAGMLNVEMLHFVLNAHC